jgi:hypothetical protein
VPKKKLHVYEDRLVVIGAKDLALYAALHKWGWSSEGVDSTVWINGLPCKLRTLSSDRIECDRLDVIEGVAALEPIEPGRTSP